MAAFFQPRSGGIRNFIGRLGRSRFFTISVALHFILVLSFGSVVLVRQIPPRKDFDDTGDLVQASAAPAQESVQPLEQPNDNTPTETNNSPANVLSPLSTINPGAAFSLPAAAPTDDVVPNVKNLGLVTAPTNVNTAVRPGGIPPQVARDMKKFTDPWRRSDDTGSGVDKSRAFKFTAFLAKYAGGDWDSTVKMTGNQISKGSLPNLLYIIRKMSRDKIDAEPDAVPLDIASDDLFTKHPPFILFTGHRDFVLTDKEVENLGKYLQLGGCVWGDSSLPGNNSRFDIAFRREMKRVLPDQDITWQALPPDHPLFVKKYYKEVVGVPSGLNYYQEPVYALKNFGEVVVLYTANDYCDMWQIALDEKLEYDLRKTDTGGWLTTDRTMFDKRTIYFRNLELPPLIDSYKFGTNIILHLLTRWEEKLRNVPTGL